MAATQLVVSSAESRPTAASWIDCMLRGQPRPHQLCCAGGHRSLCVAGAGAAGAAVQRTLRRAEQLLRRHLPGAEGPAGLHPWPELGRRVAQPRGIPGLWRLSWVRMGQGCMDENGPRLRAAGKPWQRAATPGPAAGECGPAFAYLSRPRAPLGACDRDAEALAPLLAATGPPTST